MCNDCDINKYYYGDEDLNNTHTYWKQSSCDQTQKDRYSQHFKKKSCPKRKAYDRRLHMAENQATNGSQQAKT
jgi:hypothetical protein